MSSRFISVVQRVAFSSFLRLDNIPLYIDHVLFICPAVHGQPGLHPPFGRCCCAVVQVAVRVPALRPLGAEPDGPVGLVELPFPLSVGDCGNGSLAPCPSNAAFVTPLLWLVGEPQVCAGPGFMTGWTGVLSPAGGPWAVKSYVMST